MIELNLGMLDQFGRVILSDRDLDGMQHCDALLLLTGPASR